MKIALRAALALSAALACAPLVAQSADPTKDDDTHSYDAVAHQCPHWVAVVPSDTIDLTKYPKAIYVGVGGDVAMIGAKAPPAAAGVVWKNLPSAAMPPVRPRRILATGTTATNIVACY